MTKFPLLEAMRAQREQHEAVVRAPLECELSRCAGMVASLRDELVALNRFMTSGLGEHVMDELKRGLSRGLAPALMNALAGAEETVNVPVSSHVRFMRPDESLKMLVDKAVSIIEERAHVSGRVDPVDRVTVVRMSVPAFSIERMVGQSALDAAPSRRRA